MDRAVHTSQFIGDNSFGLSEIEDQIRIWYFDAPWYQALDFVETCVEYDYDYMGKFNAALSKRNSAYRFIDGQLTEINSEDEKVEIETALTNTDRYTPVRTHLKQALALYSDRKQPDYRNSIKESISAVEALAKIITGQEKATLGQALKILEKKHHLPESLKKAFGALYGYTSNEGGVRHALTENSTEVHAEEARFILVTCSAFVNYLIVKLG